MTPEETISAKGRALPLIHFLHRIGGGVNRLACAQGLRPEEMCSGPKRLVPMLRSEAWQAATCPACQRTEAYHTAKQGGTMASGDLGQVGRRVVEVKKLPDGSNRLRIHWLIRDDAGPVRTPQGQIKSSRGPLRAGGVHGRIACSPGRASVGGEERGGVRYLCLFSDDVRAATCPECLATQEAKESLRGYEEGAGVAPTQENSRVQESAQGQAERQPASAKVGD